MRVYVHGILCVLSICVQSVRSYRAAVLQRAVREAAVALGSDLHVVGALQQKSLLQVARGGVHVGHAVLTVVGEVLRSLGGQQPQEGHLNGSSVNCQAVITIAELHWATGKEEEVLKNRQCLCYYDCY